MEVEIIMVDPFRYSRLLRFRCDEEERTGRISSRIKIRALLPFIFYFSAQKLASFMSYSFQVSGLISCGIPIFVVCSFRVSKSYTYTQLRVTMPSESTAVR
jgi:hypothetical protein